MMLCVNHQEAQEVRERQSPKNGMVDMRSSSIRGRGEIRFEITHGRFQPSQEVSGRSRRPSRLDEVRGQGGAFAKVPTFEHRPKKKPAREQLPEPWLNWPGEGAEEHTSTLLVRERDVFRHLAWRPFARRARHRPPRGRDPACCVDEGADCLAIGGDHNVKISHAFL